MFEYMDGIVDAVEEIGQAAVTKGLTALTEADFTEITQQEVKAMFA